MKKTLAMHAESDGKRRSSDEPKKGAVPAYLLDREQASRSKVLSNTVKQKRKEKAGKWEVPLPKVRPIAEEEVFKVLRSGKRKRKQWKRMITKATFVGQSFTRKPPKYERFIRPTGLRFTKAHTSSTALMHPSFSGLLVTWAYFPHTTFPPGVTRPSSETLTSITVPLVITPIWVIVWPLGFFFTPMISRQKVVLSSGCVT